MSKTYDMLPLEDRAEWVQQLNLPEVPPARDKRGLPNPEHYRCRLAILNMVSEAAVLRGEPLTKIDAVVKAINAEIALAGLDPKSIGDARSEGDKIRDAVQSLLETPNSIFEITDDAIDILTREMDNAIALIEQEVAQRQTKAVVPYSKEENDRKLAEIKLGKDWASRLRRVKRLRNLARNPVPKGITSLNPSTQEHVLRASHVLRWMVYVSRSATQEGKTTTTDKKKSDIMRLAKHHAIFALDTYEARYGIAYDLGYMRETGSKYMGVILIAPPGHTKTTFVSHYLAMEIFDNPKTQAMYIHAVDNEAKKGLAYITSMFDEQNESGRRALSLMGRMQVEENNASTFRLRLPSRLRSPTATAAAVMSARLGSDTTIQVLDDIVPASDVNEETTRKARSELIAGTFSTRFRGKGGFRLVIGTIWHQDDALAKMIEANKEAAKDNIKLYKVSRQFTGGPKSTPPFFPLWPEEYPAHELRRRFAAMNGNIALWSANYEANPIADQQRIISRLRYYDPLSPEHMEFMASATFHISVDPTATSRSTSDKAGLIYAAVGEVKTVISTAEGPQEFYQPRLRILDAHECHANQVELVEIIAAYCRARPVYMVHVETNTGFHATADMLASQHGIIARRHLGKILNKASRLKQVAGIIDNSLTTLPAIVEFPGVGDGKAEPKPDQRWQFLYNQLLDFGFTGDDHLVDAIAQLVNALASDGELVVGFGGYNVVLPEEQPKNQDPRMVRIINEVLNNKPKTADAWGEEAEWFAGTQEQEWN